MHELRLAVNITGWRVFIKRKEDKAFQSIATRVLDRDIYTCQYCAFQAKEFQEVVNLDGNYLNNKLSNMITACCFCTQCLFLQAVGLDEMGGGQLIYLPEMTQADVNSFCHVLFCAMGNSTGYQESAQSVYRSLKFRSQMIENKFGSSTSQPNIFGQILLEYQEMTQEKKHYDVLENIRLLPSHTKFQVQLDTWAAAALEELREEITE
ncbi:MAG TPA: type IVB secretion system protein IcmJDotN [Gammaproteobacteria bacterium]|nr:type IVB secretion system protein IcmJDotN [Gammaproteobacteria bacterium]